MRSQELARLPAVPAELLDELPVAREPDQAIAVLLRVRRAWPVAIGDQDVAVRRRAARRRLEERVLAGLADAGLAEREQQLPVLIELENLVPLHARVGRIVERSAVSRPEVSVLVLTEA